MKMKALVTIGLTTLTLSGLAACSSPQTSSPTSSTQAQAENSAEEAEDAEEPTDGAKSVARQVDNITLPPGSDPMAIVFANREAPVEPTESEQIRLTHPAKTKAIVTVTKTDLRDDSVAASRRRYEFKAVEGAATPQWQLVQVTEQNKCQPGRGAQDWTGALCK